MNALRWTEWLELLWRGVLLALLVWFAAVLRDLERVRKLDHAQAILTHVMIQHRVAEQTRLLQAICLSTVPADEAVRGVCDPTGTATAPHSR